MAGTLEPISAKECWTLLEELPVKVGRVGIAEPSLMILPVNYVVDDQEIIFRTAEDSLLDFPSEGTSAVFEADRVDGNWEGGWSVLASGTASQVTDEAELERLQNLDVTPWAPEGRTHYIRVQVEEVTGRRIVPHFLDPLS